MVAGNTRIGLRGRIAKTFSDKRIFLKSDNGTRFVRLGARQQVLALMGGTAVVAWSIVATSFLVIDLVKSGGAREQAALEQALYETHLNALATERDSYRSAASEAQEQFARSLQDVSRMQERLFETEIRAKELDRGSETLRGLLRQSLSERDAASARLTALSEQYGDGISEKLTESETTLAMMTEALAQTAAERDQLGERAASAETEIEEMELDARLTAEQTDRIFQQLEEAVNVSVEPLNEMFGEVGISADDMIETIRSRYDYDGQGGPLTPISMSTKGGAPDADSLRANAILSDMDELNLYRLAAQKLPLGMPIKAAVRFSSGFGHRSDPFRKSRAMHEGQDFAGPYGTPIYTTADGVITFAGWQSGYGRLVKIQHEFGIETRYGHMSRINVNVGQKVSRGDQVGAMGSTGRSTGNHLHYEVRVGGRPMNPVTYIEAAKNVF